MKDVIEHLTNALETLNYPVKEHGSYQEGDVLPESFITFQLLRSPNTKHYDNGPTSTDYHFQLAFYTRKVDLKLSANQAFKDTLLPIGYRRNGGRFLPIDKKTLHHGFVTEYRRLVNE